MSDWVERLELSDEQRQRLSSQRDPADFLLQQRWIEESQLLDVLSRHYDCPALALRRYHPDPACVHLLTEEQARRVKAIPLFRVGQHLYVGVSDPFNLQTQDFVAKLTGLVVEPVFALGRDIEEALNRSLLTSEESSRALQAITAAAGGEAQSQVQQAATLEDRDAPTIKLVDHILAQAIRLGASDLHLESFPNKVLLRYRVDGLLREFPGPPLALYNAVISRIKISAGMDIAERRLPQDGRSSLVVDDKKYDLRVSIIPNVNGEGVVIRILNPHAVQLELTSLGFEAEILDRYEKILKRPHGIVLVTGPTGSGKSTTLYATLHRISDTTRKTITLEDPVEYQMAGITQIQVQPDIGYTFAQGLRAILRHDPDVVLVGEIRDLESAQIAVRAALTGHQMFSTLHTNDAPQAITRLMDMGIPLYQIQASLNGVLAQRLVRRLCPRCKRSEESSQESLAALHLEGQFFGPLGCQECNHFGYKGRIAVHELLDFTAELRALPAESANAERIASAALACGALIPMRSSLASKVRQGLTSVDEALALLSH